MSHVDPEIAEIVKARWNEPVPEDRWGGGVKRVLEGIVTVQFEDGSFGLLDLDPNEGDAFWHGTQDYLKLLDLAAEFLNGWRESYGEYPDTLNRLLEAK